MVTSKHLGIYRKGPGGEKSLPGSFTVSDQMKIGKKEVLWWHGVNAEDVAIQHEASEQPAESYIMQYELLTIGADGVERVVRWSTPANSDLLEVKAEAESYADYITGRQHDRYGLVTAILATHLGWTPL